MPVGQKTATYQQLVERFVTTAKARGEAVTDLDTRRANVCFDQMKAIDREMRARGTEAQKALIPLLHDRNRFVQYYASIYLLGLVPDEARAVLEWNAKYGVGLIAADARGFLRELDEGTYKPD